jgi:hypothetical protein
VDDVELYGDPFNKYKAVQKFLHALLHNYMPMVMAIEQCVNLRELTIEYLCGCLLTTEEGYELDKVTDGVGKLLMTEEEWTARHQCQHGQGSSYGGDKGNNDKTGGKLKPPSGDKSGKISSDIGKRHKGNCRYCDKAGHWAKKSCEVKRDRERKGEVANLSDMRELHLRKCT